MRVDKKLAFATSLVVYALMFSATPETSLARGLASQPRIPQGTFIQYLVTQTLENGTIISVNDTYTIKKTFDNGTLETIVKWGLLGGATSKEVTLNLIPEDPRSSRINTVPVLFNPETPNDTYSDKWHSFTTEVSRATFTYARANYSVLSVIQIERDRVSGNAVGVAQKAYELGTGILLYAKYRFHFPVSGGTMNLTSTNAFQLGPSSPNANMSYILAAALVGTMALTVAYAFHLIRPRFVPRIPSQAVK